ncbi:hypothetical protein BC777_0834 [Yoonia maricola]|uniref:Uncharacterized protein n=1 Tax=Yoonia maricola TaxID=420999 RepID=A0A2M8WM62_9RHOB|nr:hypothetical protein [Yoonia maricola]PJI91993.1 hypothetical protein BC777_0834 [Yoonia maricola]
MGRRIDLNWEEWNPGLDTDDMTLAEVLATLPAANAEDVPEIIKKYENPESPDALPGAIHLNRHDCIHVLLGRGLHVQDEAFIIGVTMGAASDITNEHVDTFIRVSTTDYPKHWRFEEAHIASYRLGVGYAVDNLAGKDLHLIPLEDEPWQSMTVGAARKALGMSKHELRAYYRKAELLVPGTPASRRLDTSALRTDRSLNQPKS